MSYSDWILSIYYEYQIKNDEDKSKKEKTTTKFKNLDNKTKLKLSSYIAMVILAVCAYLYGAFSNNPIVYMIGVLLFIIPPSIMLYIDQLPLKYYKGNIIILNKILKKEGLDNIKSIEQLIIEMEGDSLIKNIRKSIAFISTGSFITTSGITYILSRIDNEFIKNLFSLIMVVVLLGATIYCILRTMSKGKMARRKEFNQLLKILLFYKQNSTKDIEDMKEVGENKEIIIKEIDLK